MIHTLPLLFSAAVTALLLTPVASADQYYKSPYTGYKDTQHKAPGKAARRACKSEIRQQVLAVRHNAQKINFNDDSFDFRNMSNGNTRIKGQGQLLTGRNYWTDFDFKCQYNNYTKRVIKASYNDSSNNVERPDHSRDTRKVCKNEIREQIRADRRHVQKIKFSGDSFDIRQLSNGNTKMRGKGQLLTGRNHWVNFDFSCLHDNYRNRVVRASYRKTSNNEARPDYAQDMRQACNHEVSRKVLRNHGSATHIRFDKQNLKHRRESRAESGLSGPGRFEGGRGKTRHFEFSCIYNHNQGYARDVWVKVY